LHKLSVIGILITLFLSGCGTANTLNGVEGIDKLDEYVTSEKIERIIDGRKSLNDAQGTGKAEIIEQLIDEYILLVEAKKQGFSVSDEEVQEVINFNIETSKEAKNERFEKYLDGLGLTTEEYYREFAYKTIKEKLLENKLHDDITKDEKTQGQKLEKWNSFKEELIREYRESNKAQIEKLKNSFQLENQ
jgi:parvulin-like peptidyl-prolyl isomerase